MFSGKEFKSLVELSWEVPVSFGVKSVLALLDRSSLGNFFSRLEAIKKVDQEYLGKKVKRWKKKDSSVKIFFRQKSKAEAVDVPPEDRDEVNDEDVNSVDWSDVKVVDNNSRGNSLLFVYQTEWLLRRYGNELALLDATYRTTQCTLPLFFLVVKMNVDYQVAVAFVCKGESTENIAEAMCTIREWNPHFMPHYFMTDYPNEEIKATEQEQAWDRWLRKTRNGCVKRWIQAYGQNRLLVNFNTNNGTERQNESLKYQEIIAITEEGVVDVIDMDWVTTFVSTVKNCAATVEDASERSSAQTDDSVKTTLSHNEKSFMEREGHQESSKTKSTIDTKCLIGEARKGNEPAFQTSDSTVTQDCTEDSFVELPASPLSYESAVPKNDRAAAGSPVAQLDFLRESTRPKNPKRPRQEKTPDNSQFLMKVIENTNQFISSASKREEPEEDDLYGQSIGKELKRLATYQKSLAKLKIQQVLHEVQWSTQE
eukprot:gene5645-10873_t